VRALAVRGSLVRLLDAVPAPIASRFDSTNWPSRLVRPIVNRIVPSQPTEVTIRSGPAKGITLLIDLRSEKYYWTGTYERAVQERLVELLRPGGIFWDVGSHIGFFTLLASRLVGKDGRVHTFEPHLANVARLEAGIKLNDARNVTVHKCAITAERGSRKLYSHNASNMWTLVPELGGALSVDVQCRALDELSRDLGRPDVIKIDVEGAECDALRGGSELLTQHRPKLIVEFSDESAVQEARLRLKWGSFVRLADRQWFLVPE